MSEELSYILLSGECAEELELKVIKNLKVGYACTGGVSVIQYEAAGHDYIYFYQAMIKI